LRPAQHLKLRRVFKPVLKALRRARGHAIGQQQHGGGQAVEIGRQPAHHRRVHTGHAKGLKRQAGHARLQRLHGADAVLRKVQRVKHQHAGGRVLQGQAGFVHAHRDGGQRGGCVTGLIRLYGAAGQQQQGW